MLKNEMLNWLDLMAACHLHLPMATADVQAIARQDRENILEMQKCTGRNENKTVPLGTQDIEN